MNLWFHLGDIFLTVFHTSLMIFNVLGWLIPSTRRLNLLSLLLTFFSWTFLGYWYGWGYCPLTDLHFSLLEKLGYRHLPPSYLQFMLDRFWGWEISTHQADLITVGGLALGFLGSLTLNLRNIREKRK
ncbi:MAG: DUF2784 family protein [Bacteroidales bacterium]